MAHKIKKYNIPIYFGKLNIVFSKDFKKTNEDLKLNCTNFDFKAICIYDHSGLDYYILFDKKPSHEVIAHEALHIVNMIFNHRGVKINTSNDEAQAYFLGWVVDRIYKAKEHFKI